MDGISFFFGLLAGAFIVFSGFVVLGIVLALKQNRREDS